MSDNERFELTNADRISSTWVRLEKHLNERLNVLRSRNDGDLNEAQTARIRGQIAELKYILSLAEDRPQI